MKRGVLLAVISVAVLMFAVPSVYADGDVAATNYYVEGYVAEAGGTGKVPVVGVTVSIADSQGNLFQSDTDSNGHFRVGISSNTGLSISFTAFGYMIISCPNTSTQQGSDFLTLTLSPSIYNSSTRTYTITSTIDEMQCAIMKTSDGIVRGTVTYDGGVVKNATVTVTPIEGGNSYSTNTDGSGRYEISCPTGLYTLKATCRGFEESEPISVNVTINPNPSPENIMMEQSSVKKYLGLDVAHILMLIGVIVGIMLAVAAWFMSKRMNGPNRLEIVDDSTDEDDDIRYP